MNSYKKIVSIVLFAGLAMASFLQCMQNEKKKETQVEVKEEKKDKFTDLPDELKLKILGMSLEKPENYNNARLISKRITQLIDNKACRLKGIKDWEEFVHSYFPKLKKIERLRALLVDLDIAWMHKNGYENVFALLSLWKDVALLKELYATPGYPIKLGNKTYHKLEDKIILVRSKKKRAFHYGLNDKEQEEIEGMFEKEGMWQRNYFDNVLYNQGLYFPSVQFCHELFSGNIDGIKEKLQGGVFPNGTLRLLCNGLWSSDFSAKVDGSNGKDFDACRKNVLEFLLGKKDKFYDDIMFFAHAVSGIFSQREAGTCEIFEENLQRWFGDAVKEDGLFSGERASLLFFAPILVATYFGNLEMVKAFIEIGKVGVDMKQSMFNITSLFVAVARGHHDIVEYLIGKGACVREKCLNGITVLHVAMMNNDKRMIQLLNGTCKDESVLSSAVKLGKKEIVEHLLDNNGVDVNEKNVEGKTALHIAFQRDDRPMVSLLICKGANGFIKDNSGKTAFEYGDQEYLHQAILEHSKKIV